MGCTQGGDTGWRNISPRWQTKYRYMRNQLTRQFDEEQERNRHTISALVYLEASTLVFIQYSYRRRRRDLVKTIGLPQDISVLLATVRISTKYLFLRKRQVSVKTMALSTWSFGYIFRGCNYGACIFFIFILISLNPARPALPKDTKHAANPDETPMIWLVLQPSK